MSDQRNLDTAFVGGLAWTTGAKLLTQFFSWGSVLILARLLSLSDFGITEMAGFIFGLTNVLAEFGIGTAVMQMHELDRRRLEQLNTASVVLCAVGYAGLVFFSQAMATFFHSEPLRVLIIVNSLNLLITGFQAVPVGLLQKDMDYRRLSVAEGVQCFVQAAVAVGCAVGGLGYWSLVAGMGAGKLIGAIMAIYWKPVAFAIPRWKDIEAPLRLGWQIAISRLTWAAYNQSDAIVVGRMLGEAVLGSYRIALNLAGAPAEKIGMLIMRVTGPLFAKVQNDTPAVRRYFKIFSEALAMSILPMMFGLVVVAPEAIRAILGAKWDSAIVPLQWLAVFIGARTLSALAQQVLTALRYTRYNMWISISSFVLMPTGFYFAARWGAGAVAATWVILAPATVLPPVVKLLRVIQLPLREYLDVLMPSMVGSAGMVAGLLPLRIWLLNTGARPMLSLVIMVAAGGALYAAVLMVFYRQRVIRYVHFLRGLRKGSEELVTDSAESNAS
jgi:O-antigen/teichoic acid export membrane protein